MMLTAVALVVVQLIVLNWPAVIVVGDAVRVAVGVCGGGGGGGGGGFCVDDPPPAHEVKIVASKKRLINPRQTCDNWRTIYLPPYC